MKINLSQNRKSNLVLWLLSCVFLLPVIAFYSGHFIHGYQSEDKVASGFVHLDMAYYMCNAREHFDSGTFKWTYGNPFSPNPETARIYFQPLVLLLALIWKFTGLDPGLIFCSVGILSAYLCLRAAMSFFREIFGLESFSKIIVLACFLWGGGLLVAFGAVHGFIEGDIEKYLIHFDPDGGWWFLNFYRNLIYTTESFYHLIFFLIMLSFLRRNFKMTLALLFLLSISHPFTGLQILSAFFVWSIFENFFVKSKVISWKFSAVIFSIILYHVSYYLFFLRAFEEHRAVMSQWAIPYLLEFENFIPAYILLVILLCMRIYKRDSFVDFFSSPENRFFCTLFSVSFVLANHEILVEKSYQPIHFSRGYIWISLFVLGAPVLIKLVEKLQIKKSSIKWGGVLLITTVFFSDNAIWLYKNAEDGVYVENDLIDIFSWIESHEKYNEDTLFVSDSGDINYYAMVYTKLKSWKSHWAITPESQKRSEEMKNYFKNGIEQKEWSTRDILLVVSRNKFERWRNNFPAINSRNFTEIYRTNGFLVFYGAR